MDIIGPFKECLPQHKKPGWYEHIVHGPCIAVIYTSLPFDDPKVEATLKKFFLENTGEDGSGFPRQKFGGSDIVKNPRAQTDGRSSAAE